MMALFSGMPLSRAQFENPNPGPRSIEEAGFLFKEGQHAFSTRDFKQAIRSLTRMIDRYPSDSRINEAYLILLRALDLESLSDQVLRYGQELMLRKPSETAANEARLLMAHAELREKNFLGARVLATELLKRSSNLTSKHRAGAIAIRFQSHLGDKQYDLAETELNALRNFLEKEPNEEIKQRIPSFRMNLQTRRCMINHLLKNTPAGEDELIEYFSKKNLCYKSALPESTSVQESGVIEEWCDSFTFFNHELQKMGMDAFLKEKIGKDLATTFELAKNLNPGLVKCYAPYKPHKSKKHRRKRTRPKS